MIDHKGSGKINPIKQVAKQKKIYFSLLFSVAAIISGTAIAMLISLFDKPLQLLVVVIGIVAVFGMLRWPVWSLFVLGFITYTRFSDILVHYHRVPSIAQLLIVLLLGMIIFRWRFLGLKPVGWKKSALLLISYGLIISFSLFYAVNTDRVIQELEDYAKDAAIALIAVILIADTKTFRGVIWALLIAGIFLGTISVYQQLTGTYENVYWGFGQANVQNIIGQSQDYRIAGPIGDPNFFAQILVVLVPLALNRLWDEPESSLRLLALWSLGVCILSIIFTFSRGGFLAMVFVLTLMFLRKPPRPLVAILTIIIAVVLLQLIPSQYVARMKTLIDLIPGIGTSEPLTEISFRGRSSELQVAIDIFQDYPVFGVGLNNFKEYYQEYAQPLGIEKRREARSAHSLYLQLAAETGMIGLSAFGVVIGVMFYSLRQARITFETVGLNDQASLVYALMVGLIGYLAAGIFLQPAYPRYLWLLFGIAMATPKLAQIEVAQWYQSKHLTDIQQSNTVFV